MISVTFSVHGPSRGEIDAVDPAMRIGAFAAPETAGLGVFVLASPYSNSCLAPLPGAQMVRLSGTTGFPAS